MIWGIVSGFCLEFDLALFAINNLARKFLYVFVAEHQLAAQPGAEALGVTILHVFQVFDQTCFLNSLLVLLNLLRAHFSGKRPFAKPLAFSEFISLLLPCYERQRVATRGRVKAFSQDRG